MKKILILPLFVGVFSLCHSSPTELFSANVEVIVTPEVAQSGILDKIFTFVSHEYYERYGIEISIEELWDGYVDGTVIVEEIVPGQSWEVRLDGGILVAVDEDSF